MARLSKSRIMSSLQCLRKVWLEVHRRDLAEYSPSTLAAFDKGHQVGEIAVAVYGRGQGEYIPYEVGLGKAKVMTAELMGGMFRAPVFEATLEHEGVLVREDVLLPASDGWRVVEVKASTKLKDEYEQDCAIQAWVHEGAGHRLESIALAHVDNQFIYAGKDDYSGLLTEVDLTGRVRELLPSVPMWVKRARDAVDGPEPVVAVGQHCTSPYECPFFKHCWPVDTEYPLHGLGGSKKKLGVLVADGYRDIRDVPAARLDSETQLRIHLVTLKGSPEITPQAGEFMRLLPYPRYFLDFETIAQPVPVWEGTRPYETLPFQWSCHVDRGDGELQHLEFLDLSGEAPMRACAERLIAELGNAGPILIYTAYEKTVIKGLMARFPDLAEPLSALIDRLIDLAPPVKQSYYHPDMMGSWSLKAMLPTIAPDLDYSALEGVHEGTEASVAYMAAIDPDTDAERKEELRKQLLEYCRYDTLAMVRLVEFFSAS